MPTPDTQQAATFLASLDLHGASFGFATFDDSGDDPRCACRLHGDMMGAVRLTGKKAGQRVKTAPFLTFTQKYGGGIFVTVNELDGRGAKAENIIRVRAMIADADTAGQVASLHQFITRTGLRPTIMVESGGLAIGPGGVIVPKLQAYWRVAGCPLDQFTPAQETLNSRTGCDPSIKDLARVLRLPGFWHQKREPRMTRIVELTDATYTFASFIQRVQAAPPVAPLAAIGYARHSSPTGIIVSAAPRDRLRVLTAENGGQLRPAVAALLAEARGPDDEGGGNRHHTMLAAVGTLVKYGWPDLAIHAAVTAEAVRLWGGPSRHRVVQKMLDHARGREAARIPANSPRRTSLVRAFGGGRG